MTDDLPTAPTSPPPPPAVAPPPHEREKTRISDVIFGWKSAVVIFIGGLILGGLGGAVVGSSGHGHHRHFERGPMMNRYGNGYVPGGGFQGGGYGVPGGGMPIPPGVQPQTPNTPKAPTPSASPKISG